MSEREHDGAVPPDGGEDLAARLKAHTQALQQSVRSLQDSLASVDAAVALSRARLFVRYRPPAGIAERRSGMDRRRHDDPVAALVRWIDGEPLERRSGADRRSPQPGALAPNVVSLEAFRRRRAGRVGPR